MTLYGALCRILYWTDRNTANPAIYRSSVINPARETVISSSLLAPTALAVDFRGKQVANHSVSGLQTCGEKTVYCWMLRKYKFCLLIGYVGVT